MCCLKCCFWCLEKFIKFINRNAYIMVRKQSVTTTWINSNSSFFLKIFSVLSDCYLWEELLRLSEKRFQSAHEKYHKVCAAVILQSSDLSVLWSCLWHGSGFILPPHRVVVLDKVTDILLFFGKLLVVGGVGEDMDSVFKNTKSCQVVLFSFTFKHLLYLK